MLLTTFTSVFLMATSWANASLIKRQTPNRGIVNACTPENINCERVAVAKVAGNFGVSGYFKFVAPRGIEEVKVILSVSGLGTYNHGPSGQNFTYHVHTDKVGEGHNCLATKGHLNPNNLPETVICDPKDLSTCEPGDLSGKHGKLSAEGTATVKRSYIDSQLRFTPPQWSMVGRSVVIHDSEKNRIACGNVVFDYPKVP